MTKSHIAFDQSARRIDTDGRLHVGRSHISKASVNPYYGKEIPGWESLGLDSNKIYKLLRDPKELEAAASTFNNLPILSKHVKVDIANPSKELIVGSIGSDVIFEDQYLDASLCIWDAIAIAGIETEKVTELSCAYRYVPVMEPGEFNGQKYDGRMTQIQGNHLALVEVGRAGSDVVVADHNPFPKEIPTMKMTALGKALFIALRMASPKLAQDSALPALVGTATRKNFNKKDVSAKLIAMDADIAPEQLDEILDALIGIEEPSQQPAAVADADPAAAAVPAAQSMKDKILALLQGKVDDATLASIGELCGDEDPDKKDDTARKEDVQTAMDSMRKEMLALSEASREVRPVVGEVIGMDSAAEIYGFALDQMKVDRDGITDTKALRALFKVASAQKQNHQSQTIAQDSAGLADKFPGAARFRNA